MPEENKEYTVNIEAVSSDGNGVGRIDGFTVFVPYTVAGDTVRIILEKVKSKFGEGRLLEIIEPSADRIIPDCKAFGRCGGCQLRHMSYDAELREKRGIIENAMRRIGGFSDFALDSITGMEEPRRYRNKAVFHIDPPVCGFYAQRSHDIIPIEDCDIGVAENGKIIAAVTEYMRVSGDAAISEIFIRKAFSTGEIMVLLTLKQSLADPNSLLEGLCAADKNIVSVITDKKGRKKTLLGRAYITDTLCGVNFNISADSFFQVNPIQTEKLYLKALEYAAPDGYETVLDIYCGIGTISLCAAKRAKKVIGVEVVERAIRDACKNAEINGIKNTEFYADRAENIVPRLIESGVKPDIVILDPPRSGSDKKTLNAIVTAAPKRIVYVSCNSATLARDSKLLSECGYKLKKASGFDLFPRTMHVETVCMFESSLTERKI